jgi:mono/diheme cytochrome c family protein
LILFATYVLLGSCLLDHDAHADEQFFREKIAPVFERHCVVCHQGEKPKAGLSLATAQALSAGGENGSVVEPGKPDESLLVEMISGDKPAMPQKARPLSREDVAAIRKWIADGAIWPEGLALRDKRLAGTDDDWWSLRSLVRPAVPKAESDWVRTPIDAFILARLNEKKLAPSPAADRRTLIRRLTYDLHGLPPTPDEIAAFLADPADDAYERLIDRLLDSPRYGERWGRHWLDVVHYGESHGYDKDKPRPNAWPYRDWVIAAFNSDMPYDKFVEQQLAGDVLSPDDPQGIVATGFISAGPWDFVGHIELREGTIDKKIARSNDRDDMVAAAMSTFQSLTVHCARCHNHKFDPIAQEDYYRLQAVFAGVDRFDRPYDRDPQIHAARRELLREKDKFLARQTVLAAIAAKITSPEIEKFDAESKTLAAQLAGLPKAEAGPVSSPTNGYHSDIMPTADAEKWVQVDLGRSLPIDEIALIPARPTDFPDTPGFGFPLRFRIDVSNHPTIGERQTVADDTTEDFANPGDKPFVVKLNEKKARYVRVTATRLWKRTNDYVFALAELQVISEKKNVALGSAVTALDSIEAGRWSRKNLVDDYTSRARLGDIAAFQATVEKRQNLELQIARLQAQRQAAVEERLDEATRTELASTARQLADIEARLKSLPAPGLVYAAAHVFAPQGGGPNLPPRPVFFLHRGSEKIPGDEVTPGAISCLPGLSGDFSLANPADEGGRRAALARWIIDPKNPLTPRSIVNRIWQYHFGRGIVDTPNDFGHMGSLPTHPELLDWLAAELVGATDSAWRLKRLHRLILKSAVYRQVSTDNPTFAAIDSGNQYLWRMNRHRLEAEALRDAVLAVSGKLDLTAGGPSHQQFFFKDDHSPVYDYERFDVDSPPSFRRSIYRFIVRSVPDPFMECLDCADPSLLTPKRNTTLTALQALSLLNNQFMVRQAEHFAARLSAATPNLDQQIVLAYQLSLGREPSADEQRLVRDYVSKNGLASLCRVIFNSNEFLFVD